MLIEFSNLNKYGNLRSRILFIESPPFSYKNYGLGKFIDIRVFKYEYEDITPPGLITTADGVKYIVPTWQQVHPKTTLSDIKWVNKIPKIEKPKTKIWEFKSSSSDQTYTVTYYDSKLKCDCMGFFRSRGNCKHVKQVKTELNDK